MPNDTRARTRVLRFLARGPHDVTVVHEYMLRDARREKEVPLRIYAPGGGGPYPLVLFSHGAGDSNATSPLLLRHWASHGYVVIAPTHLFGDRPLIERGVVRLREELLRPRRIGPEAWRERTGDLAAVMDNLDDIEANVAAVAGQIDRDRIAIAGHSFGGYTVMLMGGATLTDAATGDVHRFDDPRPRAVLIISGPGCDDMGLTRDSWQALTRPLMVMTGSRDPGPSFNSMWRAEPYLYSPAGDKFLLHLRGAHHMSYVGPIFDIPSRDPARRGRIANGIRAAARAVAKVLPAIDQVGLFDYSRAASAAFWDAYLKNDRDALDFLRSHALDEYSGSLARLKHR